MCIDHINSLFYLVIMKLDRDTFVTFGRNSDVGKFFLFNQKTCQHRNHRYPLETSTIRRSLIWSNI